MMPRLSALLVIHNEERHLAACLACLKFADELVIVLDKCSDRSQEIAESFGAQIHSGSWEIEGERRNFGMAQCTGDWILEIDADERVTPELAQEITELLAEPDQGLADHYLIPFDNYIGSRRVRYGWGANWGVSQTCRLSRCGHKSWGLQRIHPSLRLTGKQGRLAGRIDHYVDDNISDMIARLNRYSDAKAADLRANPDGVGLGRNIRRFFTRFFKCYVQRKGYREGGYGLLIALMAGLYPILSYLKATLEPAPTEQATRHD